MSNRICRKRFGRAAVALAVVSAFAAVPAGAQAQTVDLGTAKPFVALGGSAVTNAGQPSTLYGNLGVSPGTSLFSDGSVVNGSTHNNDGEAASAQAALATAYDNAAGAPSTPMSDPELGGLTLVAGGYNFATQAQLTGTLTLDGANNPNAEFIFQIGSQLTTAVASRVELIRGASPCNVYWQVGTLAALNSSTAFQGNIMAGAEITLGDSASVKGRVLTRTGGDVTLIHNVLDASMCGAGTSSPPGTTPSDGTAPVPTTTPVSGSPSSGAAPTTGTLRPFQRTTRLTRRGTATVRRGPRANCTAGFRATVRGRMIKRVAFSLDGKRISSRTRSPYAVSVKAGPGKHVVSARVTYTDATRAKTLKMRYRACAAALLQPRRGPSRFTG